MYSPSIQKLIKAFSRFPTIGPRTAARFVFYLLKLSPKETSELIDSISELKERVKMCPSCFKPFEAKTNLCEICSDAGRDKTILCVVEKETDLETIEKTKKYKGIYFILGGTVSRLRKKDVEQLRIKELKKNTQQVKEIIIAINPTTEGEATALYLERWLKKNLPADKKITKLGRGLPAGSELEYADEETLSSALEGRK